MRDYFILVDGEEFELDETTFCLIAEQLPGSDMEKQLAGAFEKTNIVARFDTASPDRELARKAMASVMAEHPSNVYAPTLAEIEQRLDS